MKIKNSIRMKLTLLLVVLMGAVILISWAINRSFVISYYMDSEEKSLISTYKALDEIYSKPGRDADLLTERIISQANVNAVILVNTNKGLMPVYPSDEINSKMYDSMVSLIKLLNDDNTSKDYEQLISDGYTIQKNSDRALRGEYLDLFGVLGDSYLVVIRSPIESIRAGAAISSRLFAYIGIFMGVIGSIAMFYVSKMFTVPIQQMAMVAKRMTNLDFDAKVPKLVDDEIGELGASMNELSFKLEQTISELKTANNELRKDIDKKEQIDEMRKEFISHVSHELKTPIALIQGYSEGLKDNINEDIESREFYCDVISDEAQKMNKMVKKLLTLNQIEFGKNQVNMERFDIVTLIKNQLAASEILYNKIGARIIMEQEEPIYVWADEFMIEEVISNYLSNARNHLSENGEITIRFEAKNREVRIFIKNTGDPIPEEDIDKLWIKFYKVDKARTREYGGSGIGLSIVAATMEAHGKAFGVANVEDGVEFYIDLDTEMPV